MFLDIPINMCCCKSHISRVAANEKESRYAQRSYKKTALEGGD